MTSLPKKRTRKPRVVAPVELPQTPEEMDKLLGIKEMNKILSDDNIPPDADGNYHIPVEPGSILAEYVKEPFMEPLPSAEVVTDKLLGKYKGNESLIEELVGEVAAPVVVMEMNVIWHNIFRYLFSKSRNIGVELHLSRPFVRRIQTLLGKQWADMTQVDKDFILGMMKEMPK